MQEHLSACFLLLLFHSSSVALQIFTDLLHDSLSHLLERLCGAENQSIVCHLELSAPGIFTAKQHNEIIT